MNIQQFLFKMSIWLFYMIRIAILAFPIVLVIVISKENGWQYGFTFIRNSMSVVLFLTFAISFLVTMYHALSFEVVGKGPLQNYLRSNQDVIVSSEKSMNELAEGLEASDLNFKKYTSSSTSINARVRARFMPPDYLTISKIENGFKVNSKPFVRWWFIDFGRNFRTVYSVAKIIKSTK